MSITSPGFFLFAAALILLYYLIPKRIQWVLLLIASVGFYLCAGWQGGVYILITALSTYGCALWISRIGKTQGAFSRDNRVQLTREERRARKAKILQKQRWVLIGGLVLNFGLLVVLKYSGFFAGLLKPLIGTVSRDVFSSWIVPLGISFYTLQSMGYLINVYQENCDAQRNFPKLLLFVCFFPQILQGPISSYSQLGAELYREHPYSFDNLRLGLRRMLWGYFKKLVVADTIAPFVAALFQNYTSYAGLTAFIGIALYSIQLYADFSGYMDIVCGLSKTLGITLRENFDRPFFAGSVAEYWRRWHMSLGDWFKTCLYYPIAVSGWARKLGKTLSKRSPQLGKTLPATLALIVVWLATGLWHGASWAYVVWGGINGLFLILSLWMEPLFQRVTGALRLTEDNRAWQVFRVLRTNFILVFLRILPEVGTLKDGFGLWASVFRNRPLIPSGWEGWFPYGANPTQLVLIVLGFGLMMAADAIKCREPLQQWMDRRSILGRFGFYFLLLVVLLIFGCYGTGYDARDFMYFKF